MLDDLRKKSFPPVVGEAALVLMLGSLPGDASLSRSEYYAHPRNAFWPIMAEILSFPAGIAYNTRLDFLRRGRIALWDVVASGQRPGSLDNDITEIVANDIDALLKANPTIRAICCNGGTSYTQLNRHFPQLRKSEFPIYKLPSTSPAAARWRYEEKREAYRKVLLPLLRQRADEK